MEGLNILVDGQNLQLAEKTTVGEALQKALSGKKFKSALAGRVTEKNGSGTSGQILDLSAQIPANAVEISPIFADSSEGLAILRHSAAHVMAAAVKHLYPKAKIAIGPAIDNGFYYDFDVEKPFSSEDFAAIEAEMQKIITQCLPFVRQELPREEAIARFREEDEPYKAEIAAGLAADVPISTYACGDFTDLCKGPHVPNTSFIKACKLVSAAGAYWRGDEKNPMLSRIYGTAFPDAKSLAVHLERLEQAKARDHRKLGRDLSFFTFHEDVAPGMVFWLPKGMMVRTVLEDFWRREHLRRGYEIVQGPQLLRVETWQKSGHYDHYRENMYFTKIEDDEYGIKPMNCIGHMLIYRHDMRSYRDMPQRYFELGVVHRHEKSGVLHGLLRVRQFTQDDAHILCTPEQLEGEILEVIHLIRDLMNLFGFDFKVAISTRPKESIGTDEAWELATNALIGAVSKAGLEYEINEGDGAFYGPKIDVRLLDCLDREWQCSTIQVDFTLPERFDLVYTGSDGQKHRPVMVHRAIMGSVERFIGIIIEQYAGALPTWLAPEQARILTVTEACDEAAKKMRASLLASGVRCGIDLRNEKLGYKVREAQVAKVPYILVIGEKEAQEGALNVRLRNGDKLGLKTLDETVEIIRADAMEPFKKGGMTYSFA